MRQQQGADTSDVINHVFVDDLHQHQHEHEHHHNDGKHNDDDGCARSASARLSVRERFVPQLGRRHGVQPWEFVGARECPMPRWDLQLLRASARHLLGSWWRSDLA